MILQVGVKVILQKGNKYLVLRRNPEVYENVDDLWDIPGGRIDPGLSLIDNLKRELMEETSIELKSAPKLIAAQDILKVKDRHVVRLTYKATTEQEPQLDGEEHTEYKWLTLEELGSLEGLDKYFKEVLEDSLLDN